VTRDLIISTAIAAALLAVLWAIRIAT